MSIAVSALRELVPVCALLSMSFFWAGHVAYSKVINALTLEEVAGVMVLYMSGIVPVLLLLLWWRKEGRPSFVSTGMFFFVTAFAGYLLPVLIEVRVTPHIPVVVFLFATTLAPAVTLGVTGLLRLERVGWLRLLGLGFGLGAVFVILGNPFAENQGWNVWYLCALLMPLTYGLVDLFIEHRWPKGLSLMQAAAGDACLAFVFVMIFAAFVGVEPELLVSLVHEKTAPLLGMVVTALSSTLVFFWIVRMKGAVYVSFGAFIALLIGIPINSLFFEEAFPTGFYPATGLLVVSLLLLNVGTRKRL